MRWAILSAPAVGDSGLSDLVTARLSSLRGIELVERESLDAIAAEYSFAQLGGAGALGKRMQLGKLLRADRLLLLSRAAVEGISDEADAAAEVVQIVIADCQTGARIGQEFYPVETEPAVLIDAISTAVEQTQLRFPGGVVRVVGVSHFLSRNLLHSYDHRQAGYANLLHQALALHPGTAVLEIEEARAIAQELALGAPPGGTPSVHRSVPVLVDGEFTVSEDRGGGMQTVALNIHIRRSSGVEQVRRTALPPAEVVAFLTGELARRILAVNEAQLPQLSLQEQRDWLLARAEQFARVGAWDHSIGLREAALLIDPNDVSIRLDLMREHGRRMNKPLPSHETTEHVATEDIRRAFRDRVDSFHGRLAHLEFLIRNQQLTADEIFAIDPVLFGSGDPLQRSLRIRGDLDAFEVQKARETYSRYYSLAREEFRTADESKAVFMSEVFPLILSLPRTDHDRVQHHWANHLLNYHLRQVGHVVPDAETLDRLYQITEEFPASSGLCINFMHGMQEFLAIDARHRLDQIRSNQSDWRDVHENGVLVEFLERLVRHDLPAAQIYGRWGLLKRRWYLRTFQWDNRTGDTLRKEVLPDFLQELGRQAEQARQLVAFYESFDLPRNSTDRLIRDLLKDIEGRLAIFNRPADAARRPWTPYKPGEEDQLAQFEFTSPVDIRVKTLSGESRAVIHKDWQTLSDRWGNYRRITKADHYPIVGWRKCEENLDVLWNRWVVLLMREKGLAEEIYSEPEPHFMDVKWDGRHFWILTKGDGLRVISPTGEFVRRIDSADGLLPYDQGAVLHPIEPGAICIAGSFGDQQRGWCAVIDLNSDPLIRVIHEATAVGPGAASRVETDPLTWAFEPTCVYELQDEKSSHRMLLIGRNCGDRWATALAVDLTTMQVMIPARDRVTHMTLYPLTHSMDFFLYSGKRRLIRPSGSIGQVAESAWGPGFRAVEIPRRRLCERGGTFNTFLPLGEWVYVPGHHQHAAWYRIHRDTFEEQPMVRKPSTHPQQPWHPVFKISAHYGILIAGTPHIHHGSYQQVVIHEPR